MIVFWSNLHKYLQEYKPKSWICLQEGYNKATLWGDLIAGVSVGAITLPLAIAYAIGAGVLPERGIVTAIIAGFLISLCGGSRVQIGGPTGAFMVIVQQAVQNHGYDGLACATFMAGILIMAMGFMRWGLILRFIPFPVIIGFSSAIALLIFSGQIKDLLGLSIPQVPANFIAKWHTYINNIDSCNSCAIIVAISTLIIIVILHYFHPRSPSSIIAVGLTAFLVHFLDWPLETIGSKFGSIAGTLPQPSLPHFTFDKLLILLPTAITIALLGGLEALLSASVADGITGYRHHSNIELVAQGFANMGAVIFGGIPATGAVARTVANIKMGAKTPLAGIIHALTVLFVIMFLGDIITKVPLASLSAVLVFVAWNMSEMSHFRAILSSNSGDTTILVATFILTLIINLTVAILVGVLLSAVLTLKKNNAHNIVG